MRLFDRVMRDRILPTNSDVHRMSPQEFDERIARQRLQFSGSVVILADNVCEFFYAQSSQEIWDETTDIPCAAPPFEKFWIEMKRPSRIYSEEMGVRDPHFLPAEWGFFFVAHRNDATAQEMLKNIDKTAEMVSRMDDKIRDSIPQIEAMNEKLKLHGPDFRKYLTSAERGLLQMIQGRMQLSQPDWASKLSASRGWIVEVLHVQRWEIGNKIRAIPGVIIFPAVWMYAIDEQGKIEAPPTILLSVPEEMREETSTYAQAVMVDPALLALSFMHCKNVRQRGNYPGRQERRAAERRGGPPLTRYITLEIDPMRRILETEGKSNEVGLRKALHICRGHFAEYGDSFGKKKLFGKYDGRYWIPSHVRGSIEAGQVIKDYSVLSGKN